MAYAGIGVFARDAVRRIHVELTARAECRDRGAQLALALLLLMSANAGSDDLPVIGPCDVALEQMEAVLVARVDGVTLEEYAESHSAEAMVVAAAIYKARNPAAEIQRRYEECLREQ